jgi:23S rRNA (cytosine1962-C5)-methyltransferase
MEKDSDQQPEKCMQSKEHESNLDSEPTGRPCPWVQLKYYSYHSCIYKGMIKKTSPGIQPGDFVNVYTPDDKFFGKGLFNPHARVPLRMIYHGQSQHNEDYLDYLIDRALDFRIKALKLPKFTEAFRVINSDGDSLSGLIIDRLGNTLVAEVHSLGIWQRLDRFLHRLHKTLGTKFEIVNIDPKIKNLEHIPYSNNPSNAPKTIKFTEYGVKFEVNFETAHKTGFFCDQRENRYRFAELVSGLKVLDLCCYTGGFSLAAKVLGNAAEVTGVDLDEKAIDQAKRNANLNNVRIQWVHVDAFSYARQMQQNKVLWDAVVLDPPKLILSRKEYNKGQRKYEDLNGLAISLVKPGGWFVTCSCSGLLPLADFEQIVIRSAHKLQRRLQIIDITGAAPDHPIMSNCLESRYLKVLWTRVF